MSYICSVCRTELVENFSVDPSIPYIHCPQCEPDFNLDIDLTCSDSISPILGKIIHCVKFLNSVIQLDVSCLAAKCSVCHSGKLERFIKAVPLGTSLWHVEREYVLEVLKRKDGNRTDAAKELKICLRTLRNYLATMRTEGLGFKIPPPPDNTNSKRKKGKREITVDTW